MRRYLILFVLVFIFSVAQSQQYYNFDDYQLKPFEKEINKYDSVFNFHTSVKPYLDNDILLAPKYDTISEIFKNKKKKH